MNLQVLKTNILLTESKYVEKCLINLQVLNPCCLQESRVFENQSMGIPGFSKV